jgi:hypothetical protein
MTLGQAKPGSLVLVIKDAGHYSRIGHAKMNGLLVTVGEVIHESGMVYIVGCSEHTLMRLESEVEAYD